MLGRKKPGRGGLATPRGLGGPGAGSRRGADLGAFRAGGVEPRGPEPETAPRAPPRPRPPSPASSPFSFFFFSLSFNLISSNSTFVVPGVTPGPANPRHAALVKKARPTLDAAAGAAPGTGAPGPGGRPGPGGAERTGSRGGSLAALARPCSPLSPAGEGPGRGDGACLCLGLPGAPPSPRPRGGRRPASRSKEIPARLYGSLGHVAQQAGTRSEPARPVPAGLGCARTRRSWDARAGRGLQFARVRRWRVSCCFDFGKESLLLPNVHVLRPTNPGRLGILCRTSRLTKHESRGIYFSLLVPVFSV